MLFALLIQDGSFELLRNTESKKQVVKKNRIWCKGVLSESRWETKSFVFNVQYVSEMQAACASPLSTLLSIGAMLLVFNGIA